jgi:hypothetical protein
MSGNDITIPINNPELFGQTVAEFQRQGLAFHAEVRGNNFIITITGH